MCRYFVLSGHKISLCIFQSFIAKILNDKERMIHNSAARCRMSMSNNNYCTTEVTIVLSPEMARSERHK